MTKNESIPVRLIPLGGIGEIGKNILVVEYGNDIMVVDCGLMFPDDDMFGVDLVIPDVQYLEDNKERIRAIVLTHGHEDHIGALAYVLKRVGDVPVYGTRLTLALVEARLREHGIRLGGSARVISAGDRATFGSIDVEFIHVSHSIADCVALAIDTPAGTIIHTSDFKFDQTPVDGRVMDLRRFAELGERGVLVMLSDSTNAERPGYTLSEKVVGELFRDAFRDAQGRIFVTTFASHIERIQQALDAAAEVGRRVAIVGRSMENNTRLALDLGYLKVEPGTIVDLDTLESLPSNRVVIMTTGSQGEPMSALTRMAMSDHRRVSIVPGDTVIISASTIPGNERMIGTTINRLFKQGAEVIYEAFSGFHVSGHASQEELKLMLNIVRPRYFVPVHGEYRHLVKHARLAQEVGIPRSNIIIPELGDILEFSQDGAEVAGRVTAGHLLVDGLSVGAVGNVVLRDRKLLSEDGIVVAIVAADRSRALIVGGPEIVSRGFVYLKESEDFIDEIKSVAFEVVEKFEGEGKLEVQSLKDRLRHAISSFIFERTGRRPMVIPVVLDV
ncbi:MAG: ribonuclease J [Firmicutes bacterium]|nr:ribonuclease J [Bacillota bacterium]